MAGWRGGIWGQHTGDRLLRSTSPTNCQNVPNSFRAGKKPFFLSDTAVYLCDLAATLHLLKGEIMASLRPCCYKSKPNNVCREVQEHRKNVI